MRIIIRNDDICGIVFGKYLKTFNRLIKTKTANTYFIEPYIFLHTDTKNEIESIIIVSALKLEEASLTGKNHKLKIDDFKDFRKIQEFVEIVLFIFNKSEASFPSLNALLLNLTHEDTKALMQDPRLIPIVKKLKHYDFQQKLVSAK